MCSSNNVSLVLALLTMSSLVVIKAKEICIFNRTVTGFTFCCANYSKDRNGNCNLCAPGYFGDTCEKICPNGTFGEDCGGECMCTFEDCDHVTGCPRISQPIIAQTVTDHQKLHRNETQIATATISLTILVPGLPASTIENRKSLMTSPTIKSNLSIIKSTGLYSTNEPTTYMSSSSDLKPTTGLFNSNYLLFGVGMVLAVLLAVIIVQLRLRSKSEQRTISRKETGDDIEIKVSSDSEGRPRISDKKQYSKLEQDEDKRHVYQRVESEYQEIDQCLEMVDVLSGPSKHFQEGESHIPRKCSLLPFPQKVQNKIPESLKHDEYIEPLRQEESNKSGYLESYLDPLSLTAGRMEGNDRQRHSYIEVLDSDKHILEEKINDEYNESTSKSSSSYDDVIVESATVISEEVNGIDNSYLDVLFE